MNRQPNMPGQPVTTETPLTISAHLGTGAPQVPVQPGTSVNVPIDFSDYIYHSMFQISDSMAHGTTLFEFNSEEPFKGLGRVIPKGIAALSSCTTMTTDFIVRFVPIKLPGSPCALSITRTYRPAFAGTGQAPNQEELYCQKEVVSIDMGMALDIPVTVAYNGLPIRAKNFGNIATSAITRPNTRMTVRLRNVYQHTNIQPETFSVMVFVMFANSKLNGYSLDYVTTNTFLPTI